MSGNVARAFECVVYVPDVKTGIRLYSGPVVAPDVNLTICEIGWPCRGGYRCRVHVLRDFLARLGLVAQADGSPI